MGKLTGKAAIITGAGRHGGLGEAIARRLAEDGANIMLTDIGAASGALLSEGHIGTSQELESVAAALRRHAPGIRVATRACDVRSEDDIKATVADTVGHFGRLDIIVNNAGVGFVMKPLTEMGIDEWDLVLDVNLRGPFLFTKHGAAQMIAQHKAGISTGGRIVNIASKAAKGATANFSAYASSKHGMVGLTRVSAVELGPHGITVNALCPNHVTTPLGAKQNAFRASLMGTDTDAVIALYASQIPLGRVGKAEDTANACAFLCSDDAAYITGEAMNVSGGQEMH